MSDNTSIQWAQATLNFATGCNKCSPGCAHCYAMDRTIPRLQAMGQDLLLGRKLSFTPVSSIASEKMCNEEFALLDNAYESQIIREHPDPKPFDDFLFRIRMKEIIDNHISLKVK
jgi:hypothetical protein